MKCVIYARVSTTREEQQNSLQNQISLAESVAKDKGFTVVDKYIDNGISGAGLKNRLGLNKLLIDLEKKDINVVIAKSVSRLGRNTVQSLQTAEQIEKQGVRLILPEDFYDSATSDSSMSFELKAVFAKEEALKLSQRVKLGLYESAKRGKYKASIAPYGYKMNPYTRQLEIEEITAPTIKEIFHLYLYEGWGMFKITNDLMSRGIPTPRAAAGAINAGTKWHQNTIKGILNNPAYIGNLVHHREETTKFLSDSELFKVRKKVDHEKQIVVENAHPPIISEEDFKAVQELMKNKGKRKSNGKESLFAHIAKCPDCGSGMHFKPDRRKGAYVCGGYVKYKSTYCSSHIIEEQTLLQAVKEDIRGFMKSSLKLDQLCGIAEKKARSFNSCIEKELKQIERKLTKVNKRFDNILSLHIQGHITVDQFKSQNERIAQQQQELANKEVELNSALEIKKDTSEQLQVFKNEIARFLNLDIDDSKVLKQVLQRLINKIEVFEEGKIKIHYNLSPSHSSLSGTV
ncbi:recombinase family protein [Bacillus sp. MUM 13]|uniref:recombinase family protein n=1 Tax=Bacillus sp. MUM 13 TaxID=1678001 RepID=UPI0008F5CC8F|nr:recombinase family protein [Bacillus sp. MUM 13]OIK08921.1 recombinase family protein [Bacillus sp. MUM 13]